MKAKCDYCGIEFEKKSKLRPHNFCCRKHLDAWNRLRLAEYNRTDNIVNTKEFWTAERRLQSRQRNLGKGDNITYKKVYGRHIHREIAEMQLRRKLLTLQIMAGVPIVIVSGRAGHARTSTTTDVYSHFLKSSDKEAAQKLNNLFE